MSGLTPALEVAAYAKKKGENAFFSFHYDPIVPFMTYEEAKEAGIVKELVTREIWEKDNQEYNRDNVLVSMREYLTFAFEKARNQRGLSAERSIHKMQTFLFMLGEKELADQIEDYNDYGIGHLTTIDNKYFNGEVQKL